MVDEALASASMIRLGPFTLGERLGAGGMAEVYRATHATGAQVAIKVMTNTLAGSAEWRAGFMREIRATAGLDHPNIVRLYDCGTVPEGGEALGLVPHSPWVAMELATLGDLVDAWPTHWGALRRILFDVLDALAHAHARGVIHRDLKPANILVTELDGAPALRLTDFGIAHVHTDETTLSIATTPKTTSGGTPEYMAPEQVTGRIAEQGPWTDLYALGCLAYTLAGGRPPFEGHSPLAVAMQHVTGTAAPLVPRFAVPLGFEAWIARLMTREPRGRYQRAADAAYALAQLADGFVYTPPPATVDVALSDTIAALHTLALTIDDLDWPVGGEAVAPVVHPPVPETWRAAAAPEIIRLDDAGLGLLGVRRPPLVGREAARDRLWQHLLAAHAGAPARMVALIGDRGVGTSALARWFCERAAEVGAAEVFEARHQPIDTADDGIGAMLRRHFGALGLDGAATRAHVIRQIPGPEGALLADAALWYPGGPTTFESPDVRHAVIKRYLAERAAIRPVIVFVDEGQWGGDTLTFVRALLRAALPGVLIVLAYDRIGAAVGGTQSRSQWAHLVEDPRADLIELDPLPTGIHCAFINSLLPVEGPLRHALHAHTGGNPRFTHDLLLHWVEEGWMQPGEGGFALDAPVDPWAPDFQTLHLRRFERLVDHDEAAMQVLEVAAVLGVQVRSGEWVAVCRALGLGLPVGLVDRLLRSGIALPRAGGWVFGCDSAVDALRSRASAGGRLERFNLVTARVLEARGQAVGHFLYRAGAHAEVIPRLLSKSRELLGYSEYGPMLSLLQFLNRPFDALTLPASDPRRLEARILEARALRYVAGLDRAAEVLAKIEPWLPTAPPHIAAQIAHLRATVAASAVDLPERLLRYQDARARYLALGDHAGAADCLHGEGLMEMLLGRLDDARRCMTQAVDHARRADSTGTLAWALQGLAMVKTFQDDPTGAADAQAALDSFVASGSRSGIGAAYYGLGECALLVGDVDAAEAHFERALAALVAIDAQMQMLPRAGLIATRVHRGQMAEAAAQIDAFELARSDQIFSSSQMTCRFHAMALLVRATVGAHAAVPGHLDRLEGYADLRVLREGVRHLEAARHRVEPAILPRLDALIARWQAARGEAR